MHDEPRPHSARASNAQEEIAWPKGLLGDLKQFFLDAAPRPMDEAAEAGAVGYLSGLTGRAYNVSGTGTNQYIVFLAPTGFGKDVISSGTNRLNRAVCIANSAPDHCIMDCVGPTELVSQAGIYKWLARQPNARILVGEVGKLYSQINNPNSHMHGINRALLQLYTKSGHGEIFGAQAYSKRDEVVEAIEWPAVTFIGESVPESFYGNLTEATVLDGLFPRHMLWEYAGQRAYINKRAKDAYPSQRLIEGLSNLASACATIEQQKAVKHVRFEADAEARFDEFDRWTTDTINGGQHGVANEFWSRAHLKALKLAAIAAVGENWVDPVITLALTNWATNLVARQTEKVIARFTSGDVGEVAGNQSVQERKLIEIIRLYGEKPYADIRPYNVREEMHAKGVIPLHYLTKRLQTTAAFKHDKIGATAAIQRTIKSLLDSDIIREMRGAQMNELFGCKPRSFIVSNLEVIFNKKEEWLTKL